MTDATIAHTGPDHRAAFRAASFGDVLRSDWTKLRSVRSTFWTLTVTVVVGIGLGAVPKRGRGLAAKSLVFAAKPCSGTRPPPSPP